MSRPTRNQEQEVIWKPRTTLGMMVAEGKVSSMDQIYENGMRVQEAEIVKHLLPDMKSQVVHVGIVQKQTDAGEMTRFSALVAVGNEVWMVWYWYGKGISNASSYRQSNNQFLFEYYSCKIRVWKLGVQVFTIAFSSLQGERKGR